MKHIVLTTAVVAIGAAIAIPVLAAGNHGAGNGRPVQEAQNVPQMGSGGMMRGNANGMMDGRQNGMMGMMQMMQNSQNSMMGSGPMGNGMMGHGGAGMDMFGALQNEFDVDDDGTVSPEELRTGLLGSLETYDADSSGALSLAEFETLHAARIRDLTVDRFQAFDADGDGQVTAEEIVKPADRMERMATRRAASKSPQPDTMTEGGTSEMSDSN